MMKILTILIGLLSHLSISAFLLLLPGGAVNLHAQFITHHNPLFMPATARPAVGVSVTDPVFGTTVKRLTNALTSGSLGIAPQYSKRQAWNANDSLMLLLNCDDGYFSLYDGNTGQFIRPLDDPPVGGEDVFWHPTNKYRIIYAGDSILYSYDIRTNERTPLHVFTAYTWINTRGEGNLSNDGRYYAFIGQNYDYGTGEVTFSDIVVYDLVMDQVIALMPVTHDSTAGAIDWISISPSGNYVVVDHSDSDSARHHGVEVYDRNLNFLWQRPVGAGHSDLGLDTYNQDFLVKDVYGVDSNVMRICKYRLSNGVSTTLLTLDWTFDMHLSCRNVNRPGYCFVSTFDYIGRLTDDSLSWLPFEDEVFALKLDGSGYTERIAHHHSKRFSTYTPNPDSSVYWAEPHATVNRSGTKILWGSNWRQDMNLVTSVDTYLCDFSSQPGVPAQVTLENLLIPSGQSACFNATQTITISNFTVEAPGGDAEFIAGQKVTMLPGTIVQHNAHMLARIALNNDYCQPENKLVVASVKDSGEPGSSSTEHHFRIFPNPTSGIFTIRTDHLSETVSVNVRIYNINGEILSSTSFSGIKDQEFNLTELPDGLYFARIIAGSKIEMMKLIINH
jgi:hypothetical protein